MFGEEYMRAASEEELSRILRINKCNDRCLPRIFVLCWILGLPKLELY